MKNSILIKSFVVGVALATGVVITSCKKEDYSLCDQGPTGPYQTGRATAKIENEADYARGFEDTKKLGYEDGKSQALSDSYQRGYTEGYNQGYDETYWSGYRSGESHGEDDGYYDGKINGYNAGKKRGESDGYDDGYRDGYSGRSCGDERKVKPSDDQCYNKGYTEVRNAQANYSAGYAAGLLVNPEYQRGYAEWQNDVDTITRGRNDGYPVGRTDGYNDGYSEGYEDGYEDEYRRGYNFGWDDGYDDGYDRGYDRGYNDGRNDSCFDRTKGNTASYRKSSAFNEALSTALKTPTVGYKTPPATLSKLFAGFSAKSNSLKGNESRISSAHVLELRTKAATRSWNRVNMGDVSNLIPPGKSYQFRKRPM